MKKLLLLLALMPSLLPAQDRCHLRPPGPPPRLSARQGGVYPRREEVCEVNNSPQKTSIPTPLKVGM